MPVISWVFLRKKIKHQVWIGAFTAFIGLVFISADGKFAISLGDISILSSAVLFAVQIILIGYFIQRSNPLILVAVQMLVAQFDKRKKEEK